MKFGIVTFPGSNCDYDTMRGVVDVLGEEGVYIWHKDRDLQGADVIVLPGGFSYGDYLRPGAIARFSPIMTEVVAHAKRGAPLMCICNGFQIACEAGLLPGALLRNQSLQFVSAPVTMRVENTATMFTSAYESGQRSRCRSRTAMAATPPIATRSMSLRARDAWFFAMSTTQASRRRAQIPTAPSATLPG